MKMNPEEKLKDKVVLITGVGGDIGKAILKDMLPQVKLIITSSRSEHVNLMMDGLGNVKGKLLHIPSDLTEEANVISLFKEAMEKAGQLDVVINTIGGSLYSHPIEEFPADEFDEIIRVNLRSAFLITREAFKVLKKNPQGGNIVHFVSSSAKLISKNKAPYGTAKAGLAHFIHYAAYEGAEHNIIVNGINPTYIFTQRHIDALKRKAEKLGVPLEQVYSDATKTQLIRKPMYPEDLLDVVRLLATTRVITGQVYNVTMGEIL